jgi:hypothetical protein
MPKTGPELRQCLRECISTDVYRAIISEKNLLLFRRAADGTFKPFLKRNGKFVGNISLKRVPKNYINVISSLTIALNMTAIAADLNEIKIEIRNIDPLISNTLRGAVKGGINALGHARKLSNPCESRREMLAGCRDLGVRLSALIGQLNAHIVAMPEPSTGILDGFFGSGIKPAEDKYNQVLWDIVTLRDGIVELISAYLDLDEMEVAKLALRDILKNIDNSAIKMGAAKARLIPIRSRNMVPEAFINRFGSVVSTLQICLSSSCEGHPPSISMDIKPEELILV